MHPDKGACQRKGRKKRSSIQNYPTDPQNSLKVEGGKISGDRDKQRVGGACHNTKKCCPLGIKEGPVPIEEWGRETRVSREK